MTLTWESLGVAAVIFLLRVANNGVGTIRLIVMARQQRTLTVVLAFFEALTFAVTVAAVATDLSQLLNLFAYCAGFAAGNWIGMLIEARFITSYVTVNVISKDKGHEIAVALRERGYGATETVGEGLKGQSTIVYSTVNRREVPKLLAIIKAIHPSAFVSIEETRNVSQGFIGRAVRNQPTI
jgi:uncharacterized protein YebE (UPF0316 family)